MLGTSSTKRSARTRLLCLCQAPLEEPLGIALDVGGSVAAWYDSHAALHIPPQQHLPKTSATILARSQAFKTRRESTSKSKG